MVAGRAVESKTASQVKSVKKAGQRDGRSSAKPKSSPKKELRRGKVKVKETRRVADLKSAALNTSKRRNPLTAPPATSAGEGQ
jgi:hypothetical protein